MSSPLTKFSVAISGILLAGTLAAAPAHSDTTQAQILGGDPCNAQVPTPSAPQASSLKIGTFNIQAGGSTQDFAAGVHAFLPHVDIAGLQETNSKDKAQVLANLASSGWDFYRQYRTDITKHPAEGGTEQQPVVWRSDRFVCTYAGPALLSPIYSLNGELPAFGDTSNRWFTVVHLVDKVTGQKIAILNVHMIPGVIMNGVPVPGIPRHWQLYKIQLAHLVAQAQQQEGYGRVYVLGDFNAGWKADRRHHLAHMPYREFKSIGFTSMWATETPANGLGTRSVSLIDQVWSTTKASSAKVLFALHQYSDHRPAVATYRVPAVTTP